MSDKDARYKKAIEETTQVRRDCMAGAGWIADTILPTRAMHVLSGPSGVGKTTLLLQMAHDIQYGLPLFDRFQSYPCRWALITSDRVMSQTENTLARLAYPNWEFEAHTMGELVGRNPSGKMKHEPDIMEDVIKRLSHIDLFVIEGLQGWISTAPRNRSQNKHEMMWAHEINLMLEETGKTIITTTHNPKITQPGAKDDRSNSIIGSQALIGSLSLTMLLERHEKNGKLRTVKVKGRDFADFALTFSLDTRGKFILDITTDEDGNPEIVENDEDRTVQILAFAKEAREFIADEVQKRVEGLRWMSPRHIRRLLECMIEQGSLDKTVQPGKPNKYIYRSSLDRSRQQTVN